MAKVEKDHALWCRASGVNVKNWWMMKDPSDLSKGRADAAVANRSSALRSTGNLQPDESVLLKQHSNELQSMGLGGLQHAAPSKIYTWDVQQDEQSTLDEADVPADSEREA